MNTRNRISFMAALAIALLAALALNGCSERTMTELELASANDDPIVFEDEFLGGLDYAAFEDSYYEAFSIDQTVFRTGTASMKVALPANEWAGGSFYTHGPRNLSPYNALTFYAKASRAINLTTAGLGIPIIADTEYQAEIGNIPIGTDWTLVVVPIPNPARLVNERGMFWYTMGASDTAVDIWFDDVKYANVSGITDPRPAMSTQPVQALAGEDFAIPGTRTVFSVSGIDWNVSHSPGYFTYISSDEAVAKVEGGSITAMGLGEATITATLGSTPVTGTITAKCVTEITAPIVFIDGLDSGLEYAAFLDSYYEALSIDDANGVNGSAALKFTIPAGNWAGGAFWTNEARDLTSFDALSFQAKSTGAYTLASVGWGIGMDYGTATQVEVNNLQLTADWQTFIIPIPNAARLAEEHGVFWLSTGNQGEIWFDNVQFTNAADGVVSNIRGVMGTSTVEALLDEVVPITGTQTTYDVSGTDVTVNHPPLYFDYLSSDESVVTALNGVVTAVGGGTAVVTAEVGGTAVDGQVTVTVIAPPSTAAPTPSTPRG
jgi:hypothetical protein